MKFFGLDLLAIALLFLQSRAGYGQQLGSLVLYEGDNSSQFFPEGSCIPTMNPSGFHIVEVFHYTDVQCFNFSDAKCTVANEPPYESYPYGSS
jgi:hypothetical protein